MLALFFAQAPIAADWQTGLISLGLITMIVLNIWDKLRRKPAIDDVLERKLKAQEDDTDKKIEALDRRREKGDQDNRDLVHKEVAEMKEFISDRINENRENNSSRFGEMGGKIDSLTVSFQGLSNDLFHQVGRLEGQMSGATNLPTRARKSSQT